MDPGNIPQDTLFNLDFWRGVLMIFIGVVPAFLVSYCAMAAWDWLRAKPEKQREKAERKRQLASSMKQSVDKNVYLLNEVNNHMVSHGTPYFNLDLTLLDSTAALKWEILDNVEVCRKADLVRYELTHVARKVDLLLQLTTATIKNDRLLDNARNAILEHIRPAKEHCEALSSMLHWMAQGDEPVTDA